MNQKQITERVESDIKFADELRSERVRIALEELNEKQIAFCMLMAQNRQSNTQCAIGAGYAKKSADRQASKLLKDNCVVQAIRELELAYAASYGVPARLHREFLLELSEMHKKTNPSAAVSARKLCAEIDGLTDKNKGSAGVAVVMVHTGIQRNEQVQVIDIKQDVN